MTPLRFYLGTHAPGWLARVTSVRLFVSAVRLRLQKKWPRATTRWALDSGGFSELSLRGAWSISPRQYAAEVRRAMDEIGGLDFAAVQDWMCEPFVLAKTGLTVAEHQERTIDSYLELSALAPEVPWLPVVQGWSVGDYWRHVDRYQERGVVLSRVGVGSVCRRQASASGERIMRTLAAGGLRIHAFGFKKLGIASCGDVLESADSMAWSFEARRERPFPGHTHKNCANCLDYALAWAADMPSPVSRAQQMAFAGVA
jgi:hypothetical protein